MLGTALDTRGGVASVVTVLKGAGLFDRHNILYIATHCDGSAMNKLTIALRAWLRVTWLLATRRVVLLHVHMSSRASFWRKSLFILQALLWRLPVVLHLHGSEFQLFYGHESTIWTQRLIKYVFEHVRLVIVLSQSWKAWVTQVFPEARVAVVYNPVAVPTFTVPAVRDQRTLVSLGRLGKRKGTYDLLQAFRTLLAQYPDAQLLLGGDGELERVRAYAGELGIIAHVHILGWVAGAEKQALLSRSSVYVLPSYNEGLPMSVLEAMAAGMPVVTTPVGGIPEAVRDGVDGFLIRPGDTTTLAARIAALLHNGDLRSAMGEAARSRVEQMFAVPVILEQMSGIYAEVQS